MIQMPTIVTEEFKSQWMPATPIEHYHMDKTAVSASGLKNAFESPRHFFFSWQDKWKKKVSPSMLYGQAAHCAILEPNEFNRRFVELPDFGDLRSKVNKEKKAEFVARHAPDAIFLKESDIEALKRGVDHLLRYRTIVEIIKGSAFEQTGYFREPETGLKCRFRPDIIRTDLMAMPDIKTTRSADPRHFFNDAIAMGYDIQMALYSIGIEAIHGRRPELPCFIVIENQAPYDVCLYELDSSFMEIGYNRLRKCLAHVYEGVTTGEWRGRQQGPAVLSVEQWALYKYGTIEG